MIPPTPGRMETVSCLAIFFNKTRYKGEKTSNETYIPILEHSHFIKSHIFYFLFQFNKKLILFVSMDGLLFLYRVRFVSDWPQDITSFGSRQARVLNFFPLRPPVRNYQPAAGGLYTHFLSDRKSTRLNSSHSSISFVPL